MPPKKDSQVKKRDAKAKDKSSNNVQNKDAGKTMSQDAKGDKKGVA